MSALIPLEGTSLTVLTSHYALLEDAVTTQLGPLAGRIVRKLGERGNMTLKEIALSLTDEPFQAATTALEAARAMSSNLTVESSGRAPAHGKAHTSATHGGGGGGGATSSASLEPAVLVDTAVKEMVARLVLHRVVAASPHQATYELRLGCGLFLHVLYPLIAQAALERYGAAGEGIALVVRQLAVVPLDTAVKLTKERCPSLTLTQVREAALAMEADGWLENIHGTFGSSAEEGEESATTAAAAPSTGITSSSTTAGVSHRRKRARETRELASYPCRLSIPAILRELLHDALCQWVREHFPDTGLSAALISVMLRSMYLPVDAVGTDMLLARESHTRGGGSAHAEEAGSVVTNPHGFPPLALAASSAPATPSELAHTLASLEDAQGNPSTFAHVGRAEVAAALKKMALPTSSNGGVEGPIVLTPSTGAGHGSGVESYTLSLSAAVSALHLDCCERTVFSRHGVLGVRLTKLLLKHHYLEDKTLSEEAVATQPRTRHTLSALMRDGYMYQQEVPRSAATGDRLPKNSTFLWGCSMKQSIAPTVREQLANSLLHAVTKLREAVYIARNSAAGIEGAAGLADFATTASAAMRGVVVGVEPDGSEARVGQERLRRAVRDQRNAIGLQSCAMALMRMLVVMDYFSS